MKRLLLILIALPMIGFGQNVNITGLLLSSCSKSSPQPTCEEGGTEVTP